MHVPRTMFAAAIDRFGGPEVITPHALPVPAVDAGEILIAVDTAGVGRWDADVREGYFAARKPHFPLVLGFDGAGIVAAVGSRVRRLKVGDEVYSYNWQNPKGGFYAEYVVVPADKAAPIPRRLDLRHGVGIAGRPRRRRRDASPGSVQPVSTALRTQLGRLDGPQSVAAAPRLTELALARNETEARIELVIRVEGVWPELAGCRLS
jgi:hypothetical protein